MNLKVASYGLAALLLALTLAACEQDGPAEQAGEEIDRTAEQAADKLENAAEEARDAVEEAGDEVERKTDQ